MKCPLCDTSNVEIFFSNVEDYLYKKPGRFSIVQCKNCELWFTHPFPNRSINYYPADYNVYNDPLKTSFKFRIMNTAINKNTKEVFWIKIISRIFKKQFLIPPQTKDADKKIILDVGCSTGFFLNFLKNLNWECHGIEINKKASKIAENKDINVFNGSIKNATLKENHFDVVRFNHVLEHLSNPIAAIRKSHQILKKNGLLLISVPNRDSLSRIIFGKHWRGFEIPRHYYHFSYSSLKKILEQNGFKIIRKDTASLPYLIFSTSFRFKFNLDTEPILIKIAAIGFSLIQDILQKGDAINIYATKN